MILRFTLFLLCAALMMACGESDANSSPASANGVARQLTQIQWIDSARNYGKIREGQKLAISFRFKNAGEHPLIIESVTPTCGCTVADFPRQPIAPGEEGEITGEFDSNGRQGLQHKQLTIRANVEGERYVAFDVDVLANTQAANTPQ